MVPETRPACQICGTDNTRTAFEKKYFDPTYPAKLTIKKCDNCGLLFNWPRLTTETLFDLYNNGYYFFQRRLPTEFKRIVAMYQRTIALIEDQVVTKRVLEIGSAKGYLLVVLNQLEWDVYGVEISSRAVRFAQKQFQVPCFSGTLEQFTSKSTTTKFPLVLAIDLLEHILDPAVFMQHIHKIIADKGLLIIDTPNGASANIMPLAGNWDGFNPFHVIIYSASNIKRLLTQNGFTIEKLFSYSNQKVEQPNAAISSTRPPTSGVKALTRQLNLLNFARDCRQKFWDLTDRRHLNRYLENTIHEIKQRGDYFTTPDSRETLAASNTGDNLVVIARKK